MTPKTLTTEQALDYHAWWMSDQVPPDAKYKDEPGGAEDQCRAAFLEGWECGEGATLDGAVAPLVKALERIKAHPVATPVAGREDLGLDPIPSCQDIAAAALLAAEGSPRDE